jgi:hypothetical protein
MKPFRNYLEFIRSLEIDKNEFFIELFFQPSPAVLVAFE